MPRYDCSDCSRDGPIAAVGEGNMGGGGYTGGAGKDRTGRLVCTEGTYKGYSKIV